MTSIFSRVALSARYPRVVVTKACEPLDCAVAAAAVAAVLAVAAAAVAAAALGGVLGGRLSGAGLRVQEGRAEFGQDGGHLVVDAVGSGALEFFDF